MVILAASGAAIRAEASAAGTVLQAAGLEPGCAYYLDADWLPAEGSADVPPIAVDAQSADPDAVAGTILVELAERAAAAVGGAESAVVLGSGTVARHARRLLAERGIGTAAEGPPRAVVEATGEPASVAAALRRVATLGTIVLVGEPLGRQVSLDLYPDLHVRGLTLVGLARPLPSPTAAGRRLPDPVRAELAAAASGAVLPREAGWYRLSP